MIYYDIFMDVYVFVWYGHDGYYGFDMICDEITFMHMDVYVFIYVWMYGMHVTKYMFTYDMMDVMENEHVWIKI